MKSISETQNYKHIKIKEIKDSLKHFPENVKDLELQLLHLQNLGKEMSKW